MSCKYLNKCKADYKDKYCESEPPYENSSCANFIKLSEEETYGKMLERNSKKVIDCSSKYDNNPYWKNICKIADKQRQKGIETYGQGVEDNHWDIQKRLQYLEEELVDALMYLEWCKDYLSKKNSL